MYMKLTCRVMIFMCMTLAFVFTTVANAAKPFIIDTDVGVDDAIAMVYLLQKPAIKVEAITVVGTGDADCRPAVLNTKKILALLGRESIPVACGRTLPLRGHHHFPTPVLSQSDTLSDADRFLPALKQSDTLTHQGVDLLIKTLLQAKEPVTILAIGPLTNIAEALQKAPQIKSHIKDIYIMGGAVKVAGNIEVVDSTLHNKTAEWNIYLDPYAAKVVFDSHLPLVLVPLDLTNQLPIDMAFYDLLSQQHRTPAADFIFNLFKQNLPMLQSKGWYFWDPVAAVIANDPAIATYDEQALTVAIKPEGESGRVVRRTLPEAVQSIPVKVATHINIDMFKRDLISTLNLNRH